MTAQELADALELTGYPVAYRQFKSAQEPPFICYLYAGDADLKADNQNYLSIGDYFVELYTANKDPTAEAAVETQLKALELPWAKLETFITTEDMHQVLYEVRLI